MKGMAGNAIYMCCVCLFPTVCEKFEVIENIVLGMRPYPTSLRDDQFQFVNYAL